MGYSNSVYKTAASRLSERRTKAQRDAEKRKKAVYSQIPRAQELSQAISSASIKAARAVLGGGNVADEMKKLRDENLALQRELNDLFRKNGYPEDVFEPRYFCAKCEDTGYFENNGKTVACQCLKNMLVTCACEELNRTAPLSLSTFDSFSLEYYDKQVDASLGIAPYEHMKKIFTYCKNYAESFNANSESILMKGATGLGKTYLSLAIANEAIKKGFGVIYASAPSLMSRLEKSHFSNSNDSESIENMLLECDLLIIDDLGTEFHTNFSTSHLYNIFNFRMLSDKPIIINTNLTMRELKDIYTDRFVSRISGNAQKLDFIGRDIRIRKK